MSPTYRQDSVGTSQLSVRLPIINTPAYRISTCQLTKGALNDPKNIGMLMCMQMHFNESHM